MRRALRSSLAAAVLGALACSDPGAEGCPGDVVARLGFSGVRVAAGDPGLSGLDPIPDVPDCPAAVGYPPAGTSLQPFQGTLSTDAATGAAALCRSRGFVLFGERTGSRYLVEGGTDGAVLKDCSSTCSAALRLLVTGDLLVDATGVPLFEGVLVEELTRGDVDCGTCLPDPGRACAARYMLEGRP